MTMLLLAMAPAIIAGITNDHHHHHGATSRPIIVMLMIAAIDMSSNRWRRGPCPA